MITGVWVCVVAGGGVLSGDRQAAAAVGAEPDGLRMELWQYRVPGRVRRTAAWLHGSRDLQALHGWAGT